MARQTIAKINLSHIKHNYELANQFAPQSNNMAVIKGDAYGHGLLEVAKFLQPLVPAFGVAILEEAELLREKGINKDILIFQGVNTVEELEIVRKHNLWITIHNFEQLKLILSCPCENSVKVWLKIDTGMHRLGLNSIEFNKALKLIEKCAWIDEDFVVSSHFSCSNELENKETKLQLERLDRILADTDSLKAKLSFSNSAALISTPKANFCWNRPGIMLYGLPLFDRAHTSDEMLKPAMTFESKVVGMRRVSSGESVGYGQKWTAQKDSIIATICVGYADGYPKQAKNGTPVFIRGQIAPLVGAVSMDLITIDVTNVGSVSLGDKVELWGENLSANEVASWSDTIGYDLVTGISARVPRIYV